MGVDDTPRPGFDYWYSIQGQGYHFDPDVNENGKRYKAEGYTTDIFTEKAVEFVKQEREEPFVLYLSHKVVHPNTFQYADGSLSGTDEFTPAERHKNLYEGLEILRRPNAKHYGEGKPALQRDIPGVEPQGPDTGTKDDVIRDRLRMLASADDGTQEIIGGIKSGEILIDIATGEQDTGFRRQRRLTPNQGIACL